MKHPHPTKKLHTKETLDEALFGWHRDAKKIVFTNGCFDILHRGHVEYLHKASQLGDVLVVGLNSDESVRRLGKGPERPIQDEMTRATILTALGFVDAVIIFGEDTPYELIRFVSPHVLVKGADWRGKGVVGEDIVASKGGETILIDVVEGFSTTNIVKKIRQ